MKAIRLALLLPILCLSFFDARSQDSLEPIRASDLLRVKEIGDVTVSPGGQMAVYTVRGAEGEVYRKHLYIVSAAGNEEPRRLTRGESDAMHPAWHPLSDSLAYVRVVDGLPQIFVMSLAGGEPLQLTNFEYGAERPIWSPDGNRILFSTLVPAAVVHERTSGRLAEPGRDALIRPAGTPSIQPDPEGNLLQVRAWLQQSAASDPDIVTSDVSGSSGMYRHLFVVDVSDEAEPVQITFGFRSFDEYAWMPNGEQVVASAAPLSDEGTDETQRDLLLVNADGSGSRILFDVEGYGLADPQVSPDGRMLAFLGIPAGAHPGAGIRVGLYDLDRRGEPVWLTEGDDWAVEDLQWAPDGWHLYFTASSGMGRPLYRIAPFENEEQGDVSADSLAPEENADPIVERLTDETSIVSGYGVSHAAVIYNLSDPSNPSELYVSNRAFRTTRRLTSHNSEWLEGKAVATPEVHVLRRGGVDLSYWVIRPPFRREGESRPLILAIRGGPFAADGPGDPERWFEYQYLASKGYGIVFGNPRGTTGAGGNPASSGFESWYAGPAGDVLAMAEDAAEQEWVNPERLAVLGSSFGALQAAHLLTRVNLFSAAILETGGGAQGTPADRLLRQFLIEQERLRTTPTVSAEPEVDVAEDTTALEIGPDDTTAAEEILAEIEPEDDPETATEANLADSGDLYERLTRELLLEPFTEFDSFHTPLLVIRSGEPREAGAALTETLYRTLNLLNRPAYMVRYRTDERGALTPAQRVDRLVRIYNFLEEQMSPTRAAATE